jgi:Protein of unknown function (DUF1641)
MSAPVLDVVGASDADAIRLQQRLSDPGTVATLNHLLDNAEMVAGLLDVVAGFFAHSDNIIDNVAGSYHEAVAMVTASPAGKRVVDALPKFVKLADQTLPLVEHIADVDLVERLNRSGLLDPALLDLTWRVAEGVHRAQRQATEEADQKPAGLMKIAGMANDPDVRRGLVFALRIVKELGRSLRAEGAADDAQEEGKTA